MKLRSLLLGRTKKVYLTVILSASTIMVAAFFIFSRDGKENEIPDLVDFNFHVRPILSDRCFKCHGPDANKREANLRLDTEEGAFAALKDDPSHHVIVPGDPMASALFTRISSSDTSEMMPPPSSNLTLSKREISIIKKWIQQGAVYKKHWAFIPPVKAKVPAAKAKLIQQEKLGKNQVGSNRPTKRASGRGG